MSRYDYDDYDEYEDIEDKFEDRRYRRKKRKGISSTGKWAIALVTELIVIVILGFLIMKTYVHDKYQKIKVHDLAEEELEINEGVNEDMVDYTNIALFGIDARNNSLGKGNRSDAIIICSINNETKKIKLVSVYRDTLLEVSKTDGSAVTTKVNAAYAYGGPELALQTLNKNLDLNISEYITVNWEGLTRAIDALGGVVVHIEDNELDTLNGVLAEQIEVNGINSDGVYETGYVTLNGAQATAYARIRSTDQGDITRTERQRDVLTKMFEKAKSSDLGTIDAIIDDLFPEIATSLSEDEIKALAKAVFEYQLGDTVGFPFAYTPITHETKGSVLVPADLSSNVTALHEFLFGEQGYVPTSNVQNISTTIQNETGVGAQEIVINTQTFE